MTPGHRCSVVVPVYGNEETIPALVERLDEIARAIAGGLEVVFVVDGSPDGSQRLLRNLLSGERAFTSQLIALSRNFGAFSAVKAGLEAARGDLVAVMAADLQEPASLVEEFFARLETGDFDVAVGVRTARDDPASSATASRLFWWLYRRLVQAEIPPGGVDVFACTRAVAGISQASRSRIPVSSGCSTGSAIRRVEVPYTRLARSAGRSAWSFRKRLRYLQDSIFSFTSLPIALITAVGVVGVLASFSYAVVVFVFWATGRIDVQGYTPLMLSILFMASAILIGLGVVGSYVWRTYENSKRRPTSVVMSHEEFGSSRSADVLP